MNRFSQRFGSRLLEWRVAMVALVLVSITSVGSAQTRADLENQQRDPRLKEGQMFVVRLVPAGKQLEIFVTGKEAARMRMTDVGLSASVFIGKKEVSLAPKRMPSKGEARFVIEGIESNASRLKLNIKKGQDQEEIEFENVP